MGHHHKHDHHDHKHKHKHKHEEEEPVEKRVKRGHEPETFVPIKLSEADYFSRAPEFRIWLSLRGVFFDELSGDDARSQFSSFVDEWNEGKLPETFYSGRAVEDAAHDLQGRTRFRWHFKGTDALQLGNVRDEIVRETDARIPSSSANPAPQPRPAAVERREEPVDETKRRREARKRREDEIATLDEIAPRETGHGAVVAKRAAARDERRAREASPDADDFGAAAGDGGDSFASAVAARDRAKQARDAIKKSARVAEFQKKEAEKIEMFRALAVASGGKIRDRT